MTRFLISKSAFLSIFFLCCRRTKSAPGGLDKEDDDILLIMQDFDGTMEEVRDHFKWFIIISVRTLYPLSQCR